MSVDRNNLDLASFDAEYSEISRLIEQTKSLQSHLQSQTALNPPKSPFTSPYPSRKRQMIGTPPKPPVASYIHPIPPRNHQTRKERDEFEDLERKYTNTKSESSTIPIESKKFHKYKLSNKLSEDDPAVVLEKFQMAKHYYEKKDYTKALDCFSQSLAHYRRNKVRNCVFLCNILLGMGNCYYCQGNYINAQELYDRVDLTLEQEREGLPDTGSSRISSKKRILKTYGRISPFINSGLVSFQEGNHEEALSNFLKALKCAENIIGLDRLVLSDIYHNIGVVFDEQGNIVGALKMYKKSVRIREKVLGKKHLLTVLTYENIAQVFKDLKKYKDAMKLQKQVIDTRRKLLGPESTELARGFHKMALILFDYGAFTKAVFYIDKAYKLRAKKLGENHPETRRSYKARNIMLTKKK